MEPVLHITVQQYEVLSRLDRASFGENIVLLLRMLSEPAISFITGAISIKHQLTMNPVSKLSIIPHDWFLLSLGMYVTISSQ